ncbi:3-isopropylmalate dehydrogenase-like [Condylostylus longicornis]|uniref:3-isopropylmalate dehydrogenase-like n=1 Tax=Condylostylus longicornis TaxID=2530218 RepID=UPI00244DA2F4|nr:3-isopropylmalate dehydrogenase-like [Condylostylus longicornis]
MLSATDQFTTRVYNIAVLPGDGIGPEVMDEAVKILKKVEELLSHSHDCCTHAASSSPPHGSLEELPSVRFNLVYGLVGGAAWEKYGSHLPEETIQLVDRSDAVLFGSVGGPVNAADDPKWKDAERNSLLGLREHLSLGVNVRPAVVFSSMKHLSPLKNERIAKGVDLLVVRELLGCVYFGEHRTEGDVATDVMRYTKAQIVKALEFAFQVAQLQPSKERRKVTVVDKANVLDCSRLWRRTAMEVRRGFPDVRLEFMYVDTAALQLLLNPCSLSVIATGNLFGDILSDLASGLPGSLGLMPSVSFGSKIHLYEPAGGSAQDIAGKNQANPVAQILSMAMMLRYSFGLDLIATGVQKAVEEVSSYRDIIN